MHLVALVRHDQRERRQAVGRKVPFQLVEADKALAPARIGLDVGEVDKARVLGRVECGLARSVVEFRVARRDRQRARTRQVLVITLPTQSGGQELVSKVWRVDGVGDVSRGRGPLAEGLTRVGLAIVRLVVVYAEGVAAKQSDVVGLARMHFGEEVGGVAVACGQLGDVGRGPRVQDLGVILVLFDDDEDMLIARHAFDVRRPNGKAGAHHGEGGRGDRAQPWAPEHLRAHGTVLRNAPGRRPRMSAHSTPAGSGSWGRQ